MIVYGMCRLRIPLNSTVQKTLVLKTHLVIFRAERMGPKAFEVVMTLSFRCYRGSYHSAVAAKAARICYPLEHGFSAHSLP